MTESEAIKQFKERIDIPDYKEQIHEYYEAMEMAINALEKQEKIKDLLDSCTAYPDDMCDCLVEIEKILKE